MRHFCDYGHRTNQSIVFDQLPLFIRHVGVTGLNVADTIACSIRNNRVLAAQINEKVPRFFVQAIARYGKRARWLKFLEVSKSEQKRSRLFHVVAIEFL